MPGPQALNIDVRRGLTRDQSKRATRILKGLKVTWTSQVGGWLDANAGHAAGGGSALLVITHAPGR